MGTKGNVEISTAWGPQSSVSWEALYERLAHIRRTKQNDYTGGQLDDMANYRNAAEFVDMPMGKLLLARMQEKMYRLKMFLGGTERKVSDETFTDTCVDIANLALLLGKEYSG